MELIESDDWSQEAINHWDVHHWQNFCPAVPQGLLQLTCGTPGEATVMLLKAVITAFPSVCLPFLA
eukprot:SAG22_NODE_3559_length_1641_cov_1.954604_1_plen_65_part_10